MSILNLFKKLKSQKVEEPKFENTIAPETMLRTILEGQAQTIKDIIANPTELNGITSKKLLDYWLNYEFTCYSNDMFTIVIDGKEYKEYRFTPEALADFTLRELNKHDIYGASQALSSPLDAVCVKYSEIVDLCMYLSENNLRVRKA